MKYRYLSIIVLFVSAYSAEQLPMLDEHNNVTNEDLCSKNNQDDEIIELMNVKGLEIIQSADLAVFSTQQEEELFRLSKIIKMGGIDYNDLDNLINDNETLLDKKKRMFSLLQTKIATFKACNGHGPLPYYNDAMRFVRRNFTKDEFDQALIVLSSICFIYKSIIRGQEYFNQEMASYQPFQEILIKEYGEKNDALMKTLVDMLNINNLYNTLFSGDGVVAKKYNFDIPCLLYIKMAQELQNCVNSAFILPEEKMLVVVLDDVVGERTIFDDLKRNDELIAMHEIGLFALLIKDIKDARLTYLLENIEANFDENIFAECERIFVEKHATAPSHYSKRYSFELNVRKKLLQACESYLIYYKNFELWNELENLCEKIAEFEENNDIYNDIAEELENFEQSRMNFYDYYVAKENNHPSIADDEEKKLQEVIAYVKITFSLVIGKKINS